MSAALLDREDRTTRVALAVNGRPMRVRVEPRAHLADALRDEVGLTGTHLGCEHGICGACTVLLDGEPARSCITLAVACEGAAVTTIEGLDDDPVTAALRAAFQREHALQCGYCTPGMLVTARDLVLRLPSADERRVRLGLAGNLCRCTGYVGIVRAILSVIAERRGRGIEAVTAARGLGPVGASTSARLSLAGDLLAPVPSPPPFGRDHAKQGGEGLRSAALAADGTPGPGPAFTPAHTFDQSFTVAFPPDAVFALFGQVEEVASCLPGATVTAMPAPDRVEGAIRVGLGPIVATFRGAARIEHDPDTLSGRIVGSGQDGSGRSSTQGVITYRVLPGAAPGEARVDLTVGYTLKGALAQFGRPGLVRDLAARITTAFAANLEGRLAGRPAAGPARALDPFTLVTGLLRGWIGTWLSRFRPRG